MRRFQAPTMGPRAFCAASKKTDGTGSYPDNPALGKFDWLRPSNWDFQVFWFERRLVRCGKKVCRCLAGRLHGPYLYLRLVCEPASGKRRRVYVSRRDIARVRRWAREHRRQARLERLAWTLARRLCR